MPIDTSPSNVATSALQGIPFSSLIGGPLGAAVDAQAQSAKTTIDFIQNVGLTGPPDNRKTIQVEFVYLADGKEVKLIVPLLTILPIPFLAVDEIDINFKASINASSSTYSEQNSSQETTVGGGAEVKFGWGPVSGSAHFEASYSSKKDSKATAESKYSVEYTMDVHVHAGQEDMPAGLAKVLNILGDSITPSDTKPTIQVAPSTLVASDPTKKAQTLLVTAILFDEKAMRTGGQDITIALVGISTPTPTFTADTVATEDDGTAEFEVTVPKATGGTAGEVQPAQRVKLKLHCGDPEASKTVTLIIPEYVN